MNYFILVFNFIVKYRLWFIICVWYEIWYYISILINRFKLYSPELLKIFST
nr:MAG TPA: hypothetical protein [Crassvirales sp.]